MGTMRNFTAYLTEARWATEEKLTHLEHPEDHLIKSGEPGFHHAFNTLKTTAEVLQGQDSGTAIMKKEDGAPSIVFGRNPENSRFFVASKSAFNKNPKINYTAADIEANHGHAPGLVSKLKAALEHLPRVAPRRGVFQGDFLYNKADGDVQEDDQHYHFKPQLIKYTAPKKSAAGRRINTSQIGFAVHTGYRGTSLANMKADYTPDLGGFAQHSSVNLHKWNDNFDAKQAAYSEKEHEEFKQHMNAAGNIFKAIDRKRLFGAVHNPIVQDHLQTYVNRTVRSGESPKLAGLIQHAIDKHVKNIDSVKTERAKMAKKQDMDQALGHIKTHEKNIEDLLKLHYHVQQAKHALIPALTRGDRSGYQYSIQGQNSGPEGFVAVTKDNRPSKLIDRGIGGFSQKNLQKGGFGQ